ncbi:MAG: hypothetical protein K0U78_04555 [Actinomycetia bacterium]|nr:hypothetical protein [Actinomycetes bacterium]
MVQYNFDTPADFIDELLKVVQPEELANYLYNNYESYVRDLQWEIETLQLDSMYEGFDSYEEFAEHQGQQELDLLN